MMTGQNVQWMYLTAACHWYISAPDNTFGKGFSWKNAPWFDANGLKDVAAIKKSTVLQVLNETN